MSFLVVIASILLMVGVLARAARWLGVPLGGGGSASDGIGGVDVGGGDCGGGGDGGCGGE